MWANFLILKVIWILKKETLTALFLKNKGNHMCHNCW